MWRCSLVFEWDQCFYIKGQLNFVTMHVYGECGGERNSNVQVFALGKRRNE